MSNTAGDENLRAINGDSDLPSTSPVTTKATTLEQPAEEPVTAANNAADMADQGFMSQIIDRLDKISTEMKDIKTDVSSLRSELNEVKQGVHVVNNTTNTMDSKIECDLREIKATLTLTREELNTSRIRLGMTEQLLAASYSANATLSKRITLLENRSRQCNILIDGVMESDGEELRKVVLDLANQICPGKVTNESFSAIYRLGRKSTPNGSHNSRRPRIILVSFKDVRTRNLFYYARTKLKDNDQLRGIYLNDDVTIETKRARDEYRSVANLARSSGAMVRVHDDGIVLDGTKYKLFEPDTLPANYTLSKAKTVSTQNGIFFHSESSFLSNFSPSPIWADDHAYPTAEHRYQSLKCEITGDLVTRNRVMAAASPLEAKRIADLVPENAEWRGKRLEIMKSVLDEKFAQNKNLANLLVGTGQAKLYEATANNYFGIGATLHSREVRDMSFKGLNKLGELLQAKRTELQTNTSTQGSASK